MLNVLSVLLKQKKKKKCLKMYYKGENIILWANSVKTYQFKAKASEVKLYLL